MGYTLENVRGDWSAESDDGGVCLAIWRKELGAANGLPCLDLLELWEDRLPQAKGWMSKPGHKKRIRHLHRAMDEFGGKVDVVFVSGTPGDSYDDADSWVPEQRGGVWKLLKFDASTGLFRVEVMKGLPS